jgi:dUTP pyrophosphatase
LIGTGIALEIPVGFVGLIYARSGLATKEGLAPANKVGVIDPDYRGEVLVSLFNQSNKTRKITPGQRIAQLVFMEVPETSLEEVKELSPSARETGGFGSTGK